MLQEHFVDFARSDPLARAYLLRAAFALLQCMHERGFEVGAQHLHVTVAAPPVAFMQQELKVGMHV